MKPTGIITTRLVRRYDPLTPTLICGALLSLPHGMVCNINQLYLLPQLEHGEEGSGQVPLQKA